MKNSSGKELVLNLGNDISNIEKPISSNTNLQNTCESWNLRALDSICIIDSLVDDQNRKQLAFKRKRENNILAWALIGGALDSTSGEDSVLDGALLGGLFGFASSGSADTPQASILLTFTNGDKLGLTVNQKELLQIMEVKQEDGLIAGKLVAPLTSSQKTYILECRKSEEQSENLMVSFMCIVGALFSKIFFEDLFQGAYGQIINNIMTWGLVIVSVWVALYTGGIIGQQGNEKYLKENEQL